MSHMNIFFVIIYLNNYINSKKNKLVLHFITQINIKLNNHSGGVLNACLHQRTRPAVCGACFLCLTRVLSTDIMCLSSVKALWGFWLHCSLMSSLLESNISCQNREKI